jgi:hypothetical protein
MLHTLTFVQTLSFSSFCVCDSNYLPTHRPATKQARNNQPRNTEAAANSNSEYFN